MEDVFKCSVGKNVANLLYAGRCSSENERNSTMNGDEEWHEVVLLFLDKLCGKNVVFSSRAAPDDVLGESMTVCNWL